MNDSWWGRELLLPGASRWAEHWNCDRPVSEWCRGRAKRKEQMMERSPCHSAETRRGARSGGGNKRVHERQRGVHARAEEENRSRREHGGRDGAIGSVPKESASVDLHLLKSNTQVSLQNSISRIACACLALIIHSINLRCRLNEGCSWS